MRKQKKMETITLYPVFKIILVIAVFVGLSYMFWTSRTCEGEVFVERVNQGAYITLEKIDCGYEDAIGHLFIYLIGAIVGGFFALLWIIDNTKSIRVEVA